MDDLTILSDKELVDRCCTGDHRAWHFLVEKFGKAIYFGIQKIKAKYNARLPIEDVEDLFQDVFIALREKNYHRLRLYKGTSPLRNYLITIAMNRTIDLLNRKQKHVSLDETIPVKGEGSEEYRTVFENMDKDALFQVISAHMKELKEIDQNIIQLSTIQGISIVEIAKRLNMSQANVSQRKMRAIIKLKKIMDGYE